MRDQLIDDCALAALLKAPHSRASRRIWIGLADREAVSLRDNWHLSSVWDMVAHMAFVQLQRSRLLLSGAIVSMAVIYLAPPLLLLGLRIHREAAAFAFAATAYLLMTESYIPTMRIYHGRAWKALLLPLAAVFYMLMTLSSALRHWRGAGGLWKGRSYN